MPLFGLPNNSANLIAQKNALEKLYRDGGASSIRREALNGGYASPDASRAIEQAYRQPAATRLPTGSNIAGEGIRNGARSAAAQAAASSELPPASLTGRARAFRAGAQGQLEALRTGAQARASGLLGQAGAGATGRATAAGTRGGGALGQIGRGVGIVSTGLTVAGAGYSLSQGAPVGRTLGGLTGNLAGTAAGAKAGAAVGASLGSVIPGAGTAAGGLVGGVLGGLAGSLLGQRGGEAVGGLLDPSQSPSITGPIPSPDGYTAPGPIPPFTGGQSPGVRYLVTVEYTVISSGGSARQTYQIDGPVQGPEVRQLGSSELRPTWFMPGAYRNGIPQGATIAQTKFITNVRITSVRRRDDQPDTGGDPEAEPEPIPASPPNRSPTRTSAAPSIGLNIAPSPTRAPATRPSAPGITPGTTPADAPNSDEDGKPGGFPFPFPPLIPAIGRPPRGNPANTQQPSGQNQGGAGGDGKRPPSKSKGNCNSKCSAGLTAGLKTLNNNQQKLADQIAGLAAQGAELALLQKIDNKLGPQLSNGGISGFLGRMNGFIRQAWSFTKVDKALNALNTLLLLHNAAMLSRSLASSLGELATQALTVFGVQDAEGNPIDVNDIVGGSLENAAKTVLGDQLYQGVTESWAKANNILSSASNIIWTVRSLFDSAREITEWTAENVGKIGNALKRWRVVGEDAYEWLPERVTAQGRWARRVNNFREGVEELDSAASSLSGVLGEVQNIQQESQELAEQKEAFTAAIAAAAPQERADNEPVSTARTASLEESKSPELSVEDQARGDQEGT